MCENLVGNLFEVHRIEIRIEFLRPEKSPLDLGRRMDAQTNSVRRPKSLHTSAEVAHVGAPLVPTDEELGLATEVYEWISPSPLYAGIDLLDTQEYGLLVLELELVEPALYLRHSPEIADKFAGAVQAIATR